MVSWQQAASRNAVVQAVVGGLLFVSQSSACIALTAVWFKLVTESISRRWLCACR